MQTRRKINKPVSKFRKKNAVSKIIYRNLSFMMKKQQMKLKY